GQNLSHSSAENTILGVWTKPDSSEFAARGNLYQYVGYNPEDSVVPAGRPIRGRVFPNAPWNRGRPPQAQGWQSEGGQSQGEGRRGKVDWFGGPNVAAQYPIAIAEWGGKIWGYHTGPFGGKWIRYGPAIGVDGLPLRGWIAPLGGRGYIGPLNRIRIRFMPNIGIPFPFFDLGFSIQLLR